MKVLILSCNTGGGHNAAAQAIAEAIREHGECAEVLDYLSLAGKGVSKLVGDGYVKVVKKAPAMFGVAYKLGMVVSRLMKKSPVYYANARMARYLEEYLQENPVDAIVMPHLYPAETITYMRRNGFALPLTVAVMTDYTCIPFWEETDCDYYITPHKKLHPEIIKRGIPAYKLKAFGIPVSRQCREDISREQARDMLGLEQEKKYFLLAAGSMGTKAIVHILELLLAMRSKKENLVVICGSNQKLKKKLQQKYKNRKEVRLVGYTKKMPLYLKACDVIFTKPGGLTSTEAAVSGIPIVHIRPIPGCETKNVEFFQKHGMSIGKRSFVGQVRAGEKLLDREKLRVEMQEAQKKNSRPEAAERICKLLEELVGKANEMID